MARRRARSRPRRLGAGSGLGDPDEQVAGVDRASSPVADPELYPSSRIDEEGAGADAYPDVVALDPHDPAALGSTNEWSGAPTRVPAHDSGIRTPGERRVQMSSLEPAVDPRVIGQGGDVVSTVPGRASGGGASGGGASGGGLPAGPAAGGGGAGTVVTDPGSLAHMPALDGLRTVAVVGVLLFHGQFAWAKGGFLGVSTFFTLSGFLITRLLLAGWESTGRVDLARFYLRRLRRLLPAAILGIALAILFAAIAGTAAQKAGIAQDSVAALDYVANWRFLFTRSSYAALFSAPSPLLHYWSLSIEEQCYFVLPLLVLLVTRFTKSRKAVAVALLALAGVGFGLSVLLNYGVDRYYYGTDTRGVELLAGGVLACVLSDAALLHLRERRIGVILGWVATVVLAAMVGAWGFVDSQSTRLPNGGFVAHAVLAALVVTGIAVGRGPLAALLRWRPVAWVGAISYGLYVYHWPLFQWLDADVLAGPRVFRFAVQLALTFALATASYYLIEQPLRHGRPLRWGFKRGWQFRGIQLTAPALSAVITGAVAVSLSAGGVAVDTGRFENKITLDDVNVVAGRPRILVLGDSTALRYAGGLDVWSKETGAANIVAAALPGCSISRLGDRLDNVVNDPKWSPVPAQCDWSQSIPRLIERFHPHLVIFGVSTPEITDRRLPGDPTVRHVGDPALDFYIRSEMIGALKAASAEKAAVAWLTVLPMRAGREFREDWASLPINDPQRVAAYNKLVFDVKGLFPQLFVLDVRNVIARFDAADLVSLMPDGVHFTDAAAAELARTWLGPQLLAIVERSPLFQSDRASGGSDGPGDGS